MLAGDGAADPHAAARARYNRGILLADHIGRDGVTQADAERDLHEAIRLLEPLATQDPDPAVSQDLGRAYNNLGTVIALETGRATEARDLYARAVRTHEALSRREPQNREYVMELVKFHNNLADASRELGDIAEATRHNAHALDRIEWLARPAPSVGIERADTYNLLGRIGHDRASERSPEAYRRALELFIALGRDENTRSFPEFHERFGDLLVNLADRQSSASRAAHARILADAVRAYLDLVERAAQSGSPAEARQILTTTSRVRPALSGSAASSMEAALRRLTPALTSRAAAPSDPNGPR